MASQGAAPGAQPRVLVVQEGPGKVVSFSPSAPAKQTVIDVGDKPHEIEVTPDGRTAYVSNFGLLEANHQVGEPGTTISVLDVGRSLERANFELPAGSTAPHGLKLRPPKYRELFTNSEMGVEAMIVFAADTGTVLRTFKLSSGVHNFIFSDDGKALFAFTIGGDILRIDPDSGAVVRSAKVSSPRGLAWTAGGRKLIVGGKNELLVLNPRDLSLETRVGELGVGQALLPIGDARRPMGIRCSHRRRRAGDRCQDLEGRASDRDRQSPPGSSRCTAFVGIECSDTS